MTTKKTYRLAKLTRKSDYAGPYPPRTKEIIGDLATHDSLAEVKPGDSVIILGAPLNPAATVRLFETSPLVSIEYRDDRKVVFNTQNSQYSLEIQS